eukprot:Phypoly_transcript_17105.p1 GENE.Phypoly_transcript_17105~~Phypoly_transcript_17105.p1  ORF type:complete len:264 (+),score=37.24 Phypoly_transcript_17105:64-792(+)
MTSSVYDISSSIHDWVDSQQDILHRYHKNINDLMNYLHMSVISLRTPILHHNTVFRKFLEENPKKDHFGGIVNLNCDVLSVIKNTTEDAKDLCIEKNGEAPSVQLQGNAVMCCVEAHLHFIIFELLKNAMKATLQTRNRNPIQVTIKSDTSKIFIEIKDHGQGISQENQEKIFWYYFSTTEKMEPTYTYSGLFGAPFDGLGCGLSIARVYARFMGGDIRMQSEKGKGTTAVVILDKHGNTGN